MVMCISKQVLLWRRAGVVIRRCRRCRRLEQAVCVCYVPPCMQKGRPQHQQEAGSRCSCRCWAAVQANAANLGGTLGTGVLDVP